MFDNHFQEGVENLSPRVWDGLDVCSTSTGSSAMFCCQCNPDNPHCKVGKASSGYELFDADRVPDPESDLQTLCAREGESPLFYSVLPGSKEDLCSRRPEPVLSCSHDQDLLGGVLGLDGQARQKLPGMSELGSLSEVVPLGRRSYTVQSIFDEDNLLWSGSSLGETQASQVCCLPLSAMPVPVLWRTAVVRLKH